MKRKFILVFLLFLGALSTSNSEDKTGHLDMFSRSNSLTTQKHVYSKSEIMALLQNCTQSLQLLQQMETEADLERLEKIQWRYSKGIDIIKLVYEKILSLEHHFTGLQTHQNIADMSNPHTYPDFQKARGIIEKKVQKKFQFNLPNFLENNPYVSTTYSLVSSLLGVGDPVDKQADFEKIACILDFTLRMNTDLRVINNETVFLAETIGQLKLDCENLFHEYTKPIRYFTDLKQCRENDDWNQISSRIEQLIQELEAAALQEKRSNNWEQGMIDLEFATKRVADFVSEYSQFINLGVQYYQKFDHIISNYENELICREQIPRQFIHLRIDIESTLNKFSNTYKLPELKGSQLKDLLFGS